MQTEKYLYLYAYEGFIYIYIEIVIRFSITKHDFNYVYNILHSGNGKWNIQMSHQIKINMKFNAERDIVLVGGWI